MWENKNNNRYMLFGQKHFLSVLIISFWLKYPKSFKFAPYKSSNGFLKKHFCIALTSYVFQSSTFGRQIIQQIIHGLLETKRDIQT